VTHARGPLLAVAVVGLWAALDLSLARVGLRHDVAWTAYALGFVGLRWLALSLAPGLVAWRLQGRAWTGAALAGMLASAALAAALARWVGPTPPAGWVWLGLELGALSAFGAVVSGLAVAGPRRVVLAVAGLAWLGVAARPTPPPPVPDAGRGVAADGAPDVVLITLDTFREDALSASPRALVSGLTPTLDGLAASGCRVDGAMAPAPLTGPSHGGLLSGRDPVALGTLLNGRPLARDRPWLPERFAAAGWATAAFVSSAMVAGPLGFERGFDVYDDDLRDVTLPLATSMTRLQPPATKRQRQRAHFDRAGDVTVARLDAWLGRQDPAGPPVLVWLHLYDTHAPYRPSQAARERLSGVDLTGALPDPNAYAEHPARPRSSAIRRLMGLLDHTPSRPDGDADGPRRLDQVRAYLGEAMDTDARVARALASLDLWRGDRDRVLAVVGDHGESLTEHNEFASHQHHVYRANLAVPLILLGAGPCPGDGVSTLGLGHQLLASAGLDSRSFPTFESEPVVSFARGLAHGDARGRRLNKVAVTSGAYRVIGADREFGPLFESYDLDADPAELDPTADVPPELVAALEEQLARVRGMGDPDADISAETAAALEALGYMGD
jgi:arylsulfatase A-like enzyme